MRFPPLSSWMRGRKVVDRGGGLTPAFTPTPDTPPEYGLTRCPNCRLKVAVLVAGLCRDCSPKDAA